MLFPCCLNIELKGKGAPRLENSRTEPLAQFTSVLKSASGTQDAGLKLLKTQSKNI